MASTKDGSSSRALSLALERDESRWKPCCKRSSSRDESRDRSPRGALVIIAAKLPDGRQSGNWDLRPGCSVSTNWRVLGTVHEFESTRSQMDSITMATAIRSKKWKATASPGVKIEKLEPGHVAEAGD